MLRGITFDRIEAVWPHVEGMLQKAVDKSQHDYLLEDIYFALLSRDMQLWVWIVGEDITACCVTMINNYPNRRVCQLPYIAGQGMGDWITLCEPVIVEWAKQRGCTQLEGFCRDGWLRVLKHWRKAWTTMRRDI